MNSSRNATNNYTPAGLAASMAAGTNGNSEISLRPSKNYAFKPNTPSMLPKSAQVPINSYAAQVNDIK